MTKDAHDGPPNEMQRKHNDIDAGFHAFRDALKPQEGQFMRGATWIMNDPKDLADRPGAASDTKESDNQSVAQKLLDRNPDGTWKKRGE